MNDTFICRYCSKVCLNANSLRNHERLCNANPNRQSSGLIGFNKQRDSGLVTSWNKGLTKETDERVRKQGVTNSQRYKEGRRVSSFKGHHHTEENKKILSQKRKQYLIEHPEMVPYKLNHHSKQSYPEKYFKELFDNDEVLCKTAQEYKVGLYSLDFDLPDIKLDIEIDGEQHHVDKRIVDHDKKRNEVLNKLGWVCFRIRWSTYQKMSLECRKELIDKLKALVAQLVP